MSYLPGTASLLEELDKKSMVLLRDGRTLIGFLRSVDQFANLVLHHCIERIHVGDAYGDIPRGVFSCGAKTSSFSGRLRSGRRSRTSSRRSVWRRFSRSRPSNRQKRRKLTELGRKHSRREGLRI
uniref:U6 snRNA-associated Sm-like protein LSm1 n=1 Tax=Pseudodiaptomus poplesia TaxID=213370 RepID=A0A0U2THY8_9MAXI|nr:U6 snRNA-associated Sm-like protein LSm1 [Pseudodiaptomus poplesia]